MFETLRRWQQQRVLKSQAIPDALWRDSLESLPFLAIYTDDEIRRLRDIAESLSRLLAKYGPKIAAA